MFKTSLSAITWAIGLLSVSCALAQTAAPANEADLLKHIQVDVKNRIVRVECEVCKASYPLEFFCVSSGGNEYESVLRTPAQPKGIHAALLSIGMIPGTPVKFSEATGQWLAPHGPAVQITCEFQKDGHALSVPAYRLMRNIKDKKEVRPMTWVFTGSKVLEDKTYGADPTGYIVSVLNNELTVMDIPAVVGTALDTREWEPNLALLPAADSKVTMILQPAGKEINPDLANAGTPPPPPEAAAPSGPTVNVADVEKRVHALRELWRQEVSPNQDAVRKAAQAHYKIIEELQREQNRLVDENNRIQAVIDDLNREYESITTPHPEEAPAPTTLPLPAVPPARGAAAQP